MIYTVLQTLVLAILILKLVSRDEWKMNQGNKKASESSSYGLFTTSDFQVSKVFLLTDCVLLKHWFIAMINWTGKNGFYLWLAAIEGSSSKCINQFMLTIYLWFATPYRKPPDKITFTSVCRNSIAVFRDLLTVLVDKIIQSNNSTYFWITFALSQVSDICFRKEKHDKSSCKPYIFEQRNRKTFLTKSTNLIKRLEGKTLISNIVLSYATKIKDDEQIVNPLPISHECQYEFAIDTATSFHVCKHKELFIDGIRKTKSIYLKGIGGRVKVKGHGTISVKVTDDNDQECNLRISNVLYVPQSPTNLLSPQLWSECSETPTGTGEITVGGTTILFWDESQHSMLIKHHEALKIPIFFVEQSVVTKSGEEKVFPKLTIDPKCLRTSAPLIEVDELGNEEITIMPLDDEEAEFSAIYPKKRTVYVDELDKIDSQRRYTDNPPNNVPMPHQMIFEDCDSILGSEQTLQESSFDSSLLSENTVTTAQSNISDEKNEAGSNDIVLGMSEDQKLWLKYHYALKHLPKAYMKKLAKAGIIPRKLEKVDPPICVACLKGKQHRTPWKGRNKNVPTIRKPHHNFPGAQTSSDQMISPFGGMIPQIKGRLMKAKYYAATIFVDHFTDYTYVHLMSDTKAENTLEAKNAYEALMFSHGHKVLAYHADNGRYAEEAFKQDAKNKAQIMSYCGVGVHSQNGIAERRIKSLCEDARTMLSHGMHAWPQVVTKSLWPFALKASCRARNKFNLDEDNCSPEMKLAGVKTPPEIRNEHPLFCPVFTLHKGLQSGLGTIPKWNPRSNAGVYLGHSPEHASNVALVLNLTTGHVSPQYHVVFDDNFSTIDYISSQKEPTNWEELCKFHSEEYSMIPTTAAKMNKITQEIQWLSDLTADDTSSEVDSASQINEQQPSIAREGEVNKDNETEDQHLNKDNENDKVQTQTIWDSEGGATKTLRRSSRIREQDKKHKLSSLQMAVGMISALVTNVNPTPKLYNKMKHIISSRVREHADRLMLYPQTVEINVDGSINNMHPLCMATSSGKNDTYHFHDAMQQPDREEFIKAMIKELKDHHDNKHWRLVKRSSIGNAKTVKAIWAFKRKRRPDGSILKYKARLNAHGGMQIYGETYWDTYAPVVNWISIRMMLTLSVIHSLHTKSIDFTLAFPQADVEPVIYMEVPLGCEVPEGDYVCLLLKNLYGLKQAAKTWFEHLRDTLTLDEKLGGYGFKQSKIDPCIFFRDGLILISWVDDCLIFSRSKDLADELIASLQNSFTLTEEEDVSAYLGVEVKFCKETDTVTLSQPYLIKRIIEVMGASINEANAKSTPSVYKEILHKDEEGPDRKLSWNYRSVVGMLNYLAASTRPDILFAVHQCARFAANPKLSHERAIKRIVRYLKGTPNGGIMLRPNPKEGIKCYVDADFAGGYCDETKDDPISVYSRTGYVIFYFGCPVLWVSKLQSEISLSTVEAEYIALSAAMRDLIPFVDQVNELSKIFGENAPEIELHCTLFEDNNGALELATKPRYRPRTKHIAIKYHHFREKVQKGLISIKAIDTREQIADQFTKRLQVGIFQYLRSKLLGW